MPNWRRLLVDGPARLFDLWWIAYQCLLTAIVMIVVSGTVIALVLEFGFGIRWGW